ncbi:exopolygalacturonase-like [Macadamia integrifolia]|uniref:exopolygalacturonase-like n=1 Tax=Macadamia integrifolia TaxID=60698 RepID=UPI001C533A96|nr:exopolygalacturonase-like [Macadamia integrifolia]
MDLKWKQWCLFMCIVLASRVAEAHIFNVKDFGAKANGKTGITKALLSAWTKACESLEPSTVLIPKGKYRLGPVILKGPCKSPSIGFQVEGFVQAPSNPANFKTDGWIVFQYINGLTLFGKGTIDGQGQKAWKINNCAQNPHCKMLPISLRFNFLNNTLVRDITSLNSKNFHMNFLACKDMTVQHVKISAPGDSPNTDGIHMGISERINITDTVIATGDDCISVGPGTRNLTVTKVVCGPGHGISVGSLGKYQDEEDVSGISVRNCTFINTQNGVRIKTWPSSPVGFASDIIFEDIIMKNVSNPVILDQEYCPHFKCDKDDPSLVKLSNIKFNKIRGTSSTQLAVIIACSRGAPCKNLEIGHINLKYIGTDGAAQSTCSNVNPILSGLQFPPTCV